MIRKCTECNKEFRVFPSRLLSGRGKYCSKLCSDKYTLIKKGQHLGKQTEVKKGQRLSPQTEFKKGQIPHNFKEKGVGYSALHDWVYRHFGRPIRCNNCNSTYKLQWANKSFKYIRKREDWISLCYLCHRHYDANFGWGLASKKFPELRRSK